MNGKIYSSITVLSLLAVCAGVSSCVDSKYRIDEIDTEVQLAANGVSLPLIVIENKTIASILDDENLEGHLMVDETTGYYRLNYESKNGEGESLSIPNVVIPNIGSEISDAFDGIPAIGLSGIPDFAFEGDTRIEPLLIETRASSLPFDIAAGAPIPPASYGGEVSSNNADITLDVALPGELESIQKVTLGDGANGSLVSMKLDLGDLADIAQSLVIDVDIEMPDRYTLGTCDGVGTVDGNEYTLTGYAVPDISNATIQFYIREISMAGLDIVNNEIREVEKLKYTVNYTIATMPGAVSSQIDEEGMPKVTITGAPAFHDAMFTITDEAANLAEDIQPVSIDLDIDVDIADDIDNLRMVGVDLGNGGMTIRLSDALVLPLDGNSVAGVQITFPESFLVTPENPSHKSGNVLTIPLPELQPSAGGYDLTLGGMDWGANGKPVENSLLALGEIEVKFVGRLKKTMTWSEDIADLAIPDNISVDIEVNDNIALTNVTAKLGTSISKDIASINLSKIVAELEKADSEAVADLIPPTLALDVTSPAGITVNSTITLAPKDAEGKALAGAEPVEVDGLIIGPGDATKLFIVDESYAGDVPAGYAKFTAELKELLFKLPAKIDIGISAWTDADTEQQMPLDGGDMTLGVYYKAGMPLGFGPDMDITLRRTEDLKDTFKQLAEQKLKASEISVSVELEASFPLKISDVEARLLDGKGGTISGLEVYILGTMEGSEPDAGGTKKSTLTIGLKVPAGGDFTALSSIKKLEITLPIRPTGTDTGDRNYVKPTDYISGKAYVTLPKGIGADLGV